MSFGTRWIAPWSPRWKYSMLYIQYSEDRYITHIKKKQVFRSAYLEGNPFCPFILAGLWLCPLSSVPSVTTHHRSYVGIMCVQPTLAFWNTGGSLLRFQEGLLQELCGYPTGRGLCSDLAFLTGHSCTHISVAEPSVQLSYLYIIVQEPMPGWTPAKHRGQGSETNWSWSSAMIKKQLETEKKGKSLLSSLLRESMEEEKICLIMKLNISHVSWCFGSKVLPFVLMPTFLRENSEFIKQSQAWSCLSRLMYNISLLCLNWFPDRYPHIEDEESKTRQLEIFEFLKA